MKERPIEVEYNSKERQAKKRPFTLSLRGFSIKITKKELEKILLSGKAAMDQCENDLPDLSRPGDDGLMLVLSHRPPACGVEHAKDYDCFFCDPPSVYVSPLLHTR